MPLPSRDLVARAVVRPGTVTADLRRRALEVLLDPSLAAGVDFVCWPQDGLVHVADSAGHVTLAPDGSSALVSGRDPVADQDPYSDGTSA